jgi:hypothetical protein
MSTTELAPQKTVAEAADQSAPILLDLGEQKPKAVKRLRKGSGKLLEDVLSTIEELKTIGTISPTAQPVIVIVRERPATSSLFPLPMFVK